jgi:hypothetical protein
MGMRRFRGFITKASGLIGLSENGDRFITSHLLRRFFSAAGAGFARSRYESAFGNQ